MRCHARCLHRQQVCTAPRVGARHPAAINNNRQSKAHAFAFTSLSVLPSFGTMVSLFSTCGQTSNQHSAVLHCCLHACNHSVFQTHTPIAFLKLCWLWMNSEREPLSPACATGTTPRTVRRPILCFCSKTSFLKLLVGTGRCALSRFLERAYKCGRERNCRRRKRTDDNRTVGLHYELRNYDVCCGG
jgi:hypothetical protein